MQLISLNIDISGGIGLSKDNEKPSGDYPQPDPYYQYPASARFIQQLLDKELIENKMFGIVYDSEYEGRLIFGKYLHEVDDNYKEEDIISTPNMDNSVSDNDNGKWMMRFNLKCTGGKDNTIVYNEDSYGFFIIEKGLIKGSNNFWVKFAKQYFIDKQCKEEGDILKSYYCNKTEQFEDFPNIVLSYEGNYVFNFTKDDLFKKVGNKYIFLIVFDNLDVEEPKNSWEFGKPFFQKYAIFLKEQNDNGYEMSYSLNKYEPYKEKDDGISTQTIVIIVLSIVLAILIAAIVVYFTRYYRKNRKRRATELDDDYEYNAKEKEDPKGKLINDDAEN